MATIQYVILKHHKKQDGTFNIKFRLTHKGKQVYHSSVYFVNQNQLKKDYTLKDYKLLDAVNADLAELRRRIETFGFDIEALSAQDLITEITKPSQDNVKINFVEFAKDYLNNLYDTGRMGSYRRIRQTVNHFNDYVKSEFHDAKLINSNFLKEFEYYLRQPKKLKRTGSRGTDIVRETDGLDNKGVNAVMTNLKIIYNACKAKFNTEYNALLPNNPFEYYSIPKAPVIRKKGDDLSVDDLIELRDKVLKGRAQLARDMFMLSFYLCGINAIDLYKQDWTIKKGRLNYERSKTKHIRKDNAFISIHIPSAAKELLEHYTKEYLHRKYSSHDSFLNAINTGLGKGLTFYHARHTFATLARNKCGFSKDDVAKALNHVDNTTVTDRYIATDWSIIDRVQDGVLKLLSSDHVV